MEELSQVKNLKNKIESFIRTNTPKGSKNPIGIGWSLWQRFNMSKEDGKVFLSHESLYSFVSKKSGTQYAYRAIVLLLITDHPSLSQIIFSSKKESPLFGFKAAAKR
jgi:hypothetical protein